MAVTTKQFLWSAGVLTDYVSVTYDPAISGPQTISVTSTQNPSQISGRSMDIDLVTGTTSVSGRSTWGSATGVLHITQAAGKGSLVSTYYRAVGGTVQYSTTSSTEGYAALLSGGMVAASNGWLRLQFTDVELVTVWESGSETAELVSDDVQLAVTGSFVAGSVVGRDISTLFGTVGQFKQGAYTGASTAAQILSYGSRVASEVSGTSFYTGVCLASDTGTLFTQLAANIASGSEKWLSDILCEGNARTLTSPQLHGVSAGLSLTFASTGGTIAYTYYGTATATYTSGVVQAEYVPLVPQNTSWVTYSNAVAGSYGAVGSTTSPSRLSSFTVAAEVYSGTTARSLTASLVTSYTDATASTSFVTTPGLVMSQQAASDEVWDAPVFTITYPTEAVVATGGSAAVVSFAATQVHHLTDGTTDTVSYSLSDVVGASYVGSGSGTVAVTTGTVTFDNNKSDALRTCTVLFSGTLNGVTGTVTVSVQQAAGVYVEYYNAWTPLSLAVSATGVPVAAAGGVATLSCAVTRERTKTSGWNGDKTMETQTETVSVTPSSWALSGSGVLGSTTGATTTVTFGNNTSTDVQTGTVTAVYTEEQAGVPPTYVSVTGTLAVTQAAGVKVYGNFVVWLTLSNTEAGYNTAYVTYTTGAFAPYEWNGITGQGGRDEYTPNVTSDSTWAVEDMSSYGYINLSENTTQATRVATITSTYGSYSESVTLTQYANVSVVTVKYIMATGTDANKFTTRSAYFQIGTHVHSPAQSSPVILKSELLPTSSMEGSVVTGTDYLSNARTLGTFSMQQDVSLSSLSITPEIGGYDSEGRAEGTGSTYYFEVKKVYLQSENLSGQLSSDIRAAASQVRYLYVTNTANPSYESYYPMSDVPFTTDYVTPFNPDSAFATGVHMTLVVVISLFDTAS